MNSFTSLIKTGFFVLLTGICSINTYAQSDRVLDFDGTNDYVNIPYKYSVSGNTQSMQFWVKINSNTGSRQAIITCGGSSPSATGYEVYAGTDDKWHIEVGQGGSSFIDIQGPSINYGAWTNLAITYDQSAVRFYENGTLTSTFAISGIVSGPAFPTRLGAGNTSGAANEFFGGELDEVSLWRTTLTSGQVTSNMNNTLAGNETNLLQYYNFNEGVGSGDNTNPPINALNDLTLGNNGTLNNFALNGSSSNWISVTALPVNLINFSGVKKDGYNLLHWSTASEQNSNNFEVQRSETGNDFKTIATVGAAGNSDRTLNYQYEDRSLSVSSVYYYRLKMVDLDGATKYSSIVFIKTSSAQAITVYPNPAKDHVTINVTDKSLINSKALLTDINGKVLQRISLSQASTQVNLDTYIKGMYLLKLNDGSSVKIIKE